mmetsp:Transcript_31497/g.95208  ORF Transcript_31497/g.95208 Transcript_31497/m.95208 type:complete len:221 (-) Transcript_31497:501-1163(-)
MARRHIRAYLSLNSAPPAADAKSAEGNGKSAVSCPRPCSLGTTWSLRFATHSCSTFHASLVESFTSPGTEVSRTAELGPHTSALSCSHVSLGGKYCAEAPPAQQSSWISMRKLWNSCRFRCVCSWPSLSRKCSTTITSNILTSRIALSNIPRVLGLAQSKILSDGVPLSWPRVKTWHLAKSSSRTSASPARRQACRVAPGAVATSGTLSRVGSLWNACNK